MTGTTFQPIRVLLVDSHIMVRRGLATFLRVFDDLQLVGEAESGEIVIQLCAEVLPDVILMDMVLPDMDGATITRAIRRKFPQIKVIALTSFKAHELVKSALDAGVISYLLKDVTADQLAQAIRAAVSGRATISIEAAQALVGTANQAVEPALDLTKHEREILTLMVNGLNTSQIAGTLIVCPSTVKAHITNILSKLSLATRTKTVTLALPDRIVPDPQIPTLSRINFYPSVDMAFR